MIVWYDFQNALSCGLLIDFMGLTFGYHVFISMLLAILRFYWKASQTWNEGLQFKIFHVTLILTTVFLPGFFVVSNAFEIPISMIATKCHNFSRQNVNLLGFMAIFLAICTFLTVAYDLKLLVFNFRRYKIGKKVQVSCCLSYKF